MVLLRDIKEIVSLQGASFKEGRGILAEDLSILKNHSLITEKNKISWIGPLNKIPKELKKKIKKEISLKGKSLLPTFVECHTHSVFAGSRSQEFELRNQGVSYQEIAARGGGILSTQKAVDKANISDLVHITQSRVNRFIQQGVSVIEIKSGYGLDLKNEIKSLKVLQSLKGAWIVPTFLGAHAIPTRYKNDPSILNPEIEYLEFLKTKVIPQIKRQNLSKRVDIFIEKGFFSPEWALDYLKFCQSQGFDTTVHADQLSLSGGSDVACALGSLSADHLIQIGDAEIKKLATSKVTCVLLPLADLYMKCAYPPARRLIEQGARVALASDFNPGSCPSQDISMVGLLARLEMKMSLPEVIVAYTLGACYALNLEDQLGSIEVGKEAMFNVLEDSYQELFYSSTTHPVIQRWFNGRIEML